MNLMELRVEKLVLPAAPITLNTWTSSFGFKEVTPLERSELLAYTFLDFQGTIMCQKLLGEFALTTSTISKDSLYEIQEVVDKCEESTELDCKSAISVEFSESVHQGPLDTPEDNDNIGCKDPHTDAMVISGNDQQPSTTEKNCELTENQNQSVVESNYCQYKEVLKQYSRRKPLGIKPVSGDNYPNVQVRCR